MTTRNVIKQVSGLNAQDGAGVTLKRYIGQPALSRLDPFLMLDFFGSDTPSDYLAGFPSHPHRGFQTVTYMLAGKMRHRDSVGNEGVIEAGGIQWMNAGRGIIHEEMPEQQQGLLKGFQLWVNLPASQKMSDPGYQDIRPEDVRVVETDGITVRVLAGKYEDVSGPVKTTAVSPVFLDVSLQPGGSIDMPVPTHYSAFTLCFEGEIQIEQEHLQAGTLAVLGEGSTIKVHSPSGGRFILVSGEPINEPVVQYGPFVMNSEAEIQQALRDYQSGLFGK